VTAGRTAKSILERAVTTSSQPPYGQGTPQQYPPQYGQQYQYVPPQNRYPQGYGQHRLPQQQIPQQRQPEPPKRKRKWPFIIGGILALLVIIAAVNGGAGGGSTSSTPTDVSGGTRCRAARRRGG
jgi:hypothetical protein